MATSLPSLKSLLVASKSTEVEFPGHPGFKISVCFLSRDTLTAIRKKATKTVFKNRQPIEELDDKLFLAMYVNEVIKGWSGLKLSILEEIAPVDMSGQDPNSELPYSADEAIALMQASAIFDQFITETASDLSNFKSSNTKS